MAEARVRRSHQLGLAVAKERAQAAAGDMAAKYGAKIEWRGDDLHFARGPIKGKFMVRETEVEFYANLGLLGGLLKGKVESRAGDILDRYFSDAPKK
jgi:putative polyhydroxyalkanoate system protein